MRNALAVALLFALAACGGNGSTDPCDPAGIGAAIDAAADGSGAPSKKADALDDIGAGIVQCIAQSPTARTDKTDPLNRQYARAGLEAGKAYALAGDREAATQHLRQAWFTARFVGDAALEAEAAAALRARK